MSKDEYGCGHSSLAPDAPRVITASLPPLDFDNMEVVMKYSTFLTLHSDCTDKSHGADTRNAMRAIEAAANLVPTPMPDPEVLRIGARVEHKPSGVTGEVVAYVEGWWEVLLSDGTTVVCRPSNLIESKD